jgi:hypothetical protein
LSRAAILLLSSVAAASAMIAPASADRIRNPIAVFAGLDKITGRIIAFEVNINETVQFGSLQITPRVCWTRPATEQPQTTSFVEVDEVGLGGGNDYRRIFTGWMYAASPGLHGVEHSIYDVWATDCKGGTEIISEPREDNRGPAPAAEIRRERQQPRQPQPRPASNQQRIDVAPPQGVPVAPQQPSQRFFPTTPAPARGAAAPSSVDRDVSR